jgi:hypothetical protein
LCRWVGEISWTPKVNEKCTDVSTVKGNISVGHRNMSRGISGNQHGEVQAGVSSQEKEGKATTVSTTPRLSIKLLLLAIPVWPIMPERPNTCRRPREGAFRRRAAARLSRVLPPPSVRGRPLLAPMR